MPASKATVTLCFIIGLEGDKNYEGFSLSLLRTIQISSCSCDSKIVELQEGRTKDFLVGGILVVWISDSDAYSWNMSITRIANC